MKKTAIAFMAFAAALFTVSCQKESITENSEINPKGEGMTICAVSEGIGSFTRADMVYKYDVVWSTGDKICVKNTEKAVMFTLSGGAGTTKGIFSSDVSISGDVEGFYPSSIVTGGGLMWPANQQSGQICPMYSKKNLSSTKDQTFNFASLGSVLQIVFNTTQENVTLKSIEIKDGSATLSGAFTVDADGKASITATDKAGITLDLGNGGVALGKGANFFNIAVPAGNYQALTLTFTATNGTKCVFNGGKLDIKHNTVGKLVLTGKTFKPDLPAGALPGVFTVSNDGGTTKTQIYFSQGNLYYDGSKFNFEANQYDSTPSSDDDWSTDHISHFYWSKDPNEAIKEGYDYEQAVFNVDVFFTNADDFTVNVGGKEQGGWRTLSTKEWQYLFNTRSNASSLYKYGVTVCGKTECVVLLPDNWKWEGTVGVDWQKNTSDIIEYSEGTAIKWSTMQAAGAVCLPAAGSRNGSDVDSVGGSGNYWSSTANGEDCAYYVFFNSGNVYPDQYGGCRYYGFSVRLITECQ